MVNEEVKKMVKEQEEIVPTKIPSNIITVLDRCTPYLERIAFNPKQVEDILMKIISSMVKTDKTKIKFAVRQIFKNLA